MFTYRTKWTCSKQILFDVDGENKLHNVRFIGGWRGGKSLCCIGAVEECGAVGGAFRGRRNECYRARQIP